MAVFVSVSFNDLDMLGHRDSGHQPSFVVWKGSDEVDKEDRSFVDKPVLHSADQIFELGRIGKLGRAVFAFNESRLTS